MTHPVDPVSLRFSTHALERMYAQGIMVSEAIDVLRDGEIIEDYPNAMRGACALILGWIGSRPIHIVAAYSAKDYTLVITAYDPEPSKWSDNFRVRISQSAGGE